MKEFRSAMFGKNRFLFSSTLILITLSSALDLAMAWVLQQVFDVVGGESQFTLGQMAIIAGLYFAVFLAVELLCRETRSRFTKRAMRNYKRFAFAKISDKSISSFQRENSGRYISALTNDATSIEANYLDGSLRLWVQMLSFFGALAMMLAYSWLLTLISIALSLIPITISLIFGSKLTDAEKKVSDRNETFVGMIKDLLTGFSVIKSFKAEKEVGKLFERENSALESVKCDRSRLRYLIQSVSGLAGGAVQIGVFFVGAALTLRGDVTMGIVLAFVQLLNNVLSPIREVPILLGNRNAAIGLMKKLSDAVGENAQETGTAVCENIGNGIFVRSLTFGYTPDEEVLHNIDIDFLNGKSYAIVGGSGSGKTTLLNLLLHSYDDYGGSITLGGTELREISSGSLYDLISIIQQNVFVFDSTVQDNITMFRDFPEEKLHDAIERAGLADFIESHGADYRCGENGSGLSGGEKQRISIARSLLRGAPVLLMDEATAALDAQTAFSVTDSILKIDGLTRIIVTHRLEAPLLSRYDAIIVMRNGAVAETGRFDELMAKKGLFYSLYNTSSGN